MIETELEIPTIATETLLLRPDGLYENNFEERLKGCEAGAEMATFDGMTFVDGPCTDEAGNFYCSDLKAPAIYKFALDGTKTKLVDDLGSGLKWAPDGRLYACQGAKKRLVAFDLKQNPPAMEVIAEDVNPNDLVVTHKGGSSS